MHFFNIWNELRKDLHSRRAWRRWMIDSNASHVFQEIIASKPVLKHQHSLSSDPFTREQFTDACAGTKNSRIFNKICNLTCSFPLSFACLDRLTADSWLFKVLASLNKSSVSSYAAKWRENYLRVKLECSLAKLQSFQMGDKMTTSKQLPTCLIKLSKNEKMLTTGKPCINCI